MVRVLHILTSLDRGGIETFLMNVYRHIDRTQIQFDFVISTHRECHYTKEVLALGGQIYDIPTRREGIIKRWEALNAIFDTHSEYKIVHYHVSSLTDIMPLQIAKRKNIPVRIVHSHNTSQGGSFIHRYIHRINKLFIKRYATDFYACSDLAAKWMYNRRQYEKRDFVIINNGIDLKCFHFYPVVRLRLRKEFGFDDNQLVIGNVGRFHIQKNHIFLLEIFVEILKIRSDAYLCLVGDGELRNQIEKRIHELNIAEHVILTGVRNDIPQILSMFDVLLMPSLYEGLPVSIIEAQATGLPCILSSAITSEVKILDTLIFKSFTDSKEDWCNAVIHAANTMRPLHIETLIADAGYDIMSITHFLEEQYLLKYRSSEISVL